MSTEARQTVPVDLGSRSYEVHVGRGLLRELGAEMARLFGKGRSVVIITDSNVGPLYAERATESLREGGFELKTTITVQAGEAAKSLRIAEEVCAQMAQAGINRKSIAVALGGGVIGDLAGFCAAIYQRGIPYVQVPTTVLSQVDSSVGGKTGVNLAIAKNSVGCFHQPRLVIADIATLDSLPKREWNEGFAEIIKHAAIRDAAMFDAIDDVLDGKGDMTALIARNVAIKARIVEADEFETKGLRALLNFGHTIGHAIETAATYGHLLHGEAISMGLVAAARLSVSHGELPAKDARRLIALLERFSLPTSLPDGMKTEDLIHSLKRDKKFEDGQVRFVLLKSAGDAFVSDKVTLRDIEKAIEELRAKQNAA
jgi:3-dehydroquinate synthase